MRIRIAVISLLALACFGSRAVRAQFQEPTPEELKMTSDPKAPGAAAVYLYREETVDDEKHFHTFYARIKVLTEKGKELATVHVPYERGNFKVTDIKGRTIHADGTVVPLTAKPSDLMDVKTKDFQINSMVFTLPAVEVGSILEYRLELRYDDNLVSSPDWQIQQPYFVHKAHYFFAPGHTGYITNKRGDIEDKIMYSLVGTKDYKVVRNAAGRYSFDVVDVPATPDEDWMPPLNSIKWRLQFYYTHYFTGSQFWVEEGKRWAKDSDKFASPGKAPRNAVAELVTATDTEEQKARKLYDAVQKLENTDFTRQKSSVERKKEKLHAIRDAEDVWNQKSGTSDELALLCVALARAAGLQAWPAQVVNRNRAIFDSNYLEIGQLDDYLAIVKLGEKEVYLDPGEKMCPFATLHWSHALAGGLRDSAGGPKPELTPATPYTQTQVQRIANLTLGEDGSVKGQVRMIMSGQEALHWRQLSLRNDPDEVKKRFNEWMHGEVPDGITVDFDHFLGLDEYQANLMAIVKINGSIGAATGKRFIVPSQFFESHTKHPFVTVDKRTIPVDVRYARIDTDDVSYQLPEGWTLESAPEPVALSWPQHAQMKARVALENGRLESARALGYNFTILDPKEYGDLHDFYQKVATADQQQLVLTRAAAKPSGQ